MVRTLLKPPQGRRRFAVKVAHMLREELGLSRSANKRFESITEPVKKHSFEQGGEHGFAKEDSGHL